MFAHVIACDMGQSRIEVRCSEALQVLRGFWFQRAGAAFQTPRAA